MSEHLLQLSDADLWEITKALKSRRLEAPYSSLGIDRVITGPQHEVAADMQGLAEQGFSATQLATLLELIIKARGQRTLAEDLIDLVTSGPEAAGVSNRDTSVVVHELFSRAEKSVLLAGPSLPLLARKRGFF